MNYIAPCDMTVRSISGRSAEFKKGVPMYAPPQMHAELIARGVVPAEDLPELVVDANAEPSSAIERQGALLGAIEKIMLRNKRGDFAGTGAPHAAVLAHELGWSSLDAKERDAAWSKFQAIEADKATSPVAEDKPVEDKPVEDKPAEDKPVEDKPVEDKPVEDKPVEDKPVEDKPVEDKPVEDKPAEPVKAAKTAKAK